MTLVNSDFKELLNIFNVNHVRYLVIGGYAVLRYTEPRYTKDMDLWIGVDAANASAVFRSLREFGAPLAGITEVDFSDDSLYYQMGNPPSRIDILMSIPGVDFEDAWTRREIVEFDGISAAFIARSDLIRSKIASGRPQDLIDADALARIEE